MNLSDLDLAAPAEVAALAGLRTGKPCSAGIYAAPCPMCGAERAHAKRSDRRLAVLIRRSGAVTCCACSESVSRGDLLALARFSCRWGALSASERAVCLDAPVPAPAPPEDPPRRLSLEEWRALLGVCVSASEDEACVAWAESRGLVLPSVALAVVGDPDEGVPLWSRPKPPKEPLWLPDLGSKLIFPCFDGNGIPVGVRVRNVTGGPIKEQALAGFSATGLVMIGGLLAEEWRRDERASRPCVLVEGGPDRLAAGWAWPETHVIGMMNGSWGRGCTWLRPGRLAEETWFVFQEDAPDAHGKTKGQEYAKKIAALAPWVRCIGVSRVFEVAGVAWTPGDDLADLAVRGGLPKWREVAALAGV